MPALRHYLEGDAAFRRSRFDEARESLEQAIAEDSTFALAHWRLGETFGWIEGIAGEIWISFVDPSRTITMGFASGAERSAIYLGMGFAY